MSGHIIQSRAESFVRAEIISHKMQIKRLKTKLKNVLDSTPIFGITSKENWEVLKQAKAKELRRQIQESEQTIAQLESLDLQGKQTALENFISTHKDEGLDVEEFMDRYYRSKRRETRYYLQDSVYGAMEYQVSTTCSELELDVATIDKVAEFSEEDINKLLYQLKKDKQFKRLLRKNKHLLRGLETVSKIEDSKALLWLSLATMVVGFCCGPAVVMKYFGDLQNPLNDAVATIGMITAPAAVYAGVACVATPFIKDLIEHRAKSVNNKISSKVDQEVKQL